MRLLIKRSIGDWRIILSVGRVTGVQGVNSTLTDGNHMLMWEFDTTAYAPVYLALAQAQRRYTLPEIRILQSHPDGGFHAYCWTRMPFIRTVTIVSSTPGVDPGFITMCCARRHWTLRLTDKGQGTPKLMSVVKSLLPDESDISDLVGGVHYTTHRAKQTFGLS